jgi:hypothetical protein
MAASAVCHETDGTIKEKAMLRAAEHSFLIFGGWAAIPGGEMPSFSQGHFLTSLSLFNRVS